MLAAVLLAFHLAVAAALAARLVRVRRRRATLPVVEEAAVGVAAAEADVSVVIPARNEAHNLAACLAAVGAAGDAVREILVVDDHSEDATAAIAAEAAGRDARVRVLRAPPLPPGWTGKSHALHHGARSARGHWLLFVDADVRLGPGAAGTVLAVAHARALEVLSLSPRQRADGAWERLLQPLVFDLLDERFDMAAVNDPARPAAAANGQFLLFRRTAYERIGGHAAVRGEILEDVALARRVKAAGLGLHFATTRSLAETRMYRGFAELWAGWTKNLFLLLGGGPLGVPAAALSRALLWSAPPLTLAAALALGPGARGAAAAGALATALLLAAAASLLHARGAPLRYAPLVPAGQAVLAAMIVASWFRHVVRRGVRWKGRTYPASRAAASASHDPGREAAGGTMNGCA
jgi:hypothetical protein